MRNESVLFLNSFYLTVYESDSGAPIQAVSIPVHWRCNLALYQSGWKHTDCQDRMRIFNDFWTKMWGAISTGEQVRNNHPYLTIKR